MGFNTVLSSAVFFGKFNQVMDVNGWKEWKMVKPILAGWQREGVKLLYNQQNIFWWNWRHDWLAVSTNTTKKDDFLDNNWIFCFFPTNQSCVRSKPYFFERGFSHRCPFPIGWLINRGLCLPLITTLNDDRWFRYTKPAPLFLPKGHIWCRLTWNKHRTVPPSCVCWLTKPHLNNNPGHYWIDISTS